MSNKEHIFIIILKDKIQIFEKISGKSAELFKIKGEDYVDIVENDSASVKMALAEIKTSIIKHYKITEAGLSSFSFTVIYEKFNIENMNVAAGIFSKCGRVDFVSIEMLMPMIVGKIKTNETGLVKSGETKWKIENGKDTTVLVLVESDDINCAEISTESIVSGIIAGIKSEDNEKKVKELECENAKLKLQIKAANEKIEKIDLSSARKYFLKRLPELHQKFKRV